MNINISCSQKGQKEFPFHKHKEYEISFYANTRGFLNTQTSSYSFSPGSVVIIPPETLHSSVSDTELCGIYLKGNFGHVFQLTHPVVVNDNQDGEAGKLISLIFKNRYGNKEYLSSLCEAYVRFLATNIQLESDSVRAVNDIISQITAKSFDPLIDLSCILKTGAYSEDYIRSIFKKITGKTPVEFLTDIRISHACFLIETLGKTTSFSQIAEKCGYSDYAYFSKKFKAVTGVSPQKYRKGC